MADDTQDPRTNPGDPQIDLTAANLSNCYDLIGDGTSEISTTPPTTRRIELICYALASNPDRIGPVVTLLQIPLRGTESSGERIRLIAVALTGKPQYLLNAEHFARMGS